MYDIWQLCTYRVSDMCSTNAENRGHIFYYYTYITYISGSKISDTYYKLIVYPIYCNKYRIPILHLSDNADKYFIAIRYGCISVSDINLIEAK